MIYFKELTGFKQTNFQHPKGLITFQFTTAKEQKVSSFDRIIKQILYFTQSIHGVPYTWEKHLRFKERLFWFMVVVAAFVTCVTMNTTLANHYKRQQLKTVVENSQLPIYKVNFPAVALCPWNHVNWLRYKSAEEKFLPPNADNTSKAVFYDLLRALDDMHLSKLDSLVLLQNHTISRIIDKISINDLAYFMAFRCDDLFVECMYDETKYDCCKIFVAESTDKGVCMVFNSMMSEESRKKQITDEFYPWKNRKAGEGKGLQFTLRGNKTYQRIQTDLTDFGLDVMVKGNEEWKSSIINLFLRNKKIYLSVTPAITQTSENTRHLDPRKRRCLFADEMSKLYDQLEGLPFNKMNCIAKCQQNNLIKICNCTLYMFFPRSDVRECTVSDFKCIYANRDIFSYMKSPSHDEYIKDSRRGVTCDCVDSCYSLTFSTSSHASIIRNASASYPIIQGDIYIGQSVLTKYETRMRATAFDLTAQFGGILGLCLGTSVLNLVELVYAFLKIILLLVFTKCRPKRTISAPQRKGNFNQK